MDADALAVWLAAARPLAVTFHRAAGRMEVIAGGSVRARNARRIIDVTGVTAIHAHTDAAGLRALALTAAGRR